MLQPGSGIKAEDTEDAEFAEIFAEKQIGSHGMFIY
jgi:hypothetical protein